MTIEDTIRHKKLQHDINREAAKISALSWCKIDKYEYLTGDEILTPEKVFLFFYSRLRKALERQIETIMDQAKTKTCFHESKEKDYWL